MNDDTASSTKLKSIKLALVVYLTTTICTILTSESVQDFQKVVDEISEKLSETGELVNG